jgi:hypothetical protein
MRQTETLFAPGRYRKRRAELTVDRVIGRLRVADEWDASHDAAAAQLRAVARAVDLAEHAATLEPAPYAAQCLAVCAREFREALIAYGLAPGGAPTHDPFTDFLESLDHDPAATDHPPPT